MTTPAAGSRRKGRRRITSSESSPSRITAKETIATKSASGIVQAKSAMSGRGKGGRVSAPIA